MQLKKLKDEDEILIAEVCTHHIQDEDIAVQKIPTWLMHFTKKDLHYTVLQEDFPEDLSVLNLLFLAVDVW